MIMGEVFVEDPTVMELGFLVNKICEARSKVVLEVSFSRVVL